MRPIGLAEKSALHFKWLQLQDTFDIVGGHGKQGSTGGRRPKPLLPSRQRYSDAVKRDHLPAKRADLHVFYRTLQELSGSHARKRGKTGAILDWCSISPHDDAGWCRASPGVRFRTKDSDCGRTAFNTMFIVWLH